MEERPEDARVWMGESVFGSDMADDVVPDALLRRDCGGVCVAIECVGESYTKVKLSAFHKACEARGWGYELW
jgi:hypothetical protein